MPVAQHDGFRDLKSARDLQEPLLPVAVLPVSQAKETDHPTSPGLMSDRHLRNGFGKVRDKDRVTFLAVSHSPLILKCSAH